MEITMTSRRVSTSAMRVVLVAWGAEARDSIRATTFRTARCPLPLPAKEQGPWASNLNFEKQRVRPNGSGGFPRSASRRSGACAACWLRLIKNAEGARRS
ncbi:hypothetical protein BD309DRAFT_955967 [Dichomitus squalens]|nr:hypothetical protein BD309DRAFT_955967 [Dichomitus squalens]